MEEFINSFGKNNLIIVAAVIFAIVLSLVVIVLIEKIKNKKREELEYYDEVLEDDEDNIVYEEEKTKEKEEEIAKKTLENITKKLVEQEENNNLVTKTTFEIEQEEMSVISYDELIKASKTVDETNDALLKDEGTEPITIEELYKKHLEENDKKLDNPVFEEEVKVKEIVKEEEKQENKKEIKEEPKKFKNSEIISPVFGIYNAKKSKQNDEYLEKTMDLEDLELEIKKTEEFLNELKELKSKLN